MALETYGKRAVLVVGGGVAGMHAALILAEARVQVYLVDSAPTVGGLSNLLDKTFPTHSCGICHMSPRNPAYCPVLEVERHPRIRLMVSSTITDVSGDIGEFFVRVATSGEFVRRDLCDSCGECEKACPVVVHVPAFLGMSDRKAIYKPGHRAVPGGFVLDESACTKCGKCAGACPRGAIDLLAEGTSTELQVAAIIVSAGMDARDPRVRLEYSYNPGKNVITGLELERIMSASGPSGGRLARPSDGKVPGRVAFIQCVGSRDRSSGSPYCSSVCCMYALKEAMSVKELAPDAKVRVFYMDMRAMGKGFEEYYGRAKSVGVEFENCRVARIEEANGVLLVSGESGGVVTREEFDLVVLSTGFVPSADMRELADTLGIEMGPFGFIQALPQGRSRVKTSRPGIFVCGGAAEPQDIPTSVMWSGACALQALRVVGPGADSDEWLAGQEATQKEAISVQSGGRGADSSAEPVCVTGSEDARIGVFVCKCDSPMTWLRLAEVAEAAKALDGVALVREIPGLCRGPALKSLRAEVAGSDINRVVVAACSPRDILDLVERELSSSGAWRGLVEVANIREQCAWVHRDGEAATTKARDLVAMAVEQVRLARPLREQARKIPSSAVVIGGGPAGMQAASSLADLGHEVHLVEKDAMLGGRARRVIRTLDGSDVQGVLRQLEGRIRSDSHITIHTASRVTGISREGGRFRVSIMSARDAHQGFGDESRAANQAGAGTGTEVEAEAAGAIEALDGNGARGEERLVIDCGVIILATGGVEAPAPSSFGTLALSRIMTQTELEAHLGPPGSLPDSVESVVMIQCAGSRDHRRPYCSKVCCSQAMKNALHIKAVRPDTEVYVLHRDIRVPGMSEVFYEQAREMGVVFIRHTDDTEPRVVQAEPACRQVVEVYDEVLGEILRVPADLVVLSTGVEGAADPGLAEALGVPFDEHGFFIEANTKVGPVDFLVPGVYVCGLARAPGFLSDALISAEAAAARAGAYISAKEARTFANLSRVREKRCSGCGVCVDVCPYDARSLDEEARRARVDEFLCRGCGACQAACPSGASEHLGFEAKRILSALDVAFG